MIEPEGGRNPMVEAARDISIDGEGDGGQAREEAWERPDVTPDGDVVGVAAGVGIGPQGRTDEADDGGAKPGSYEQLMRMFGPPAIG